MFKARLTMMKTMTDANTIMNSTVINNTVINKGMMTLFMLLLLITAGCSSSYQPPSQPHSRSQTNTRLPEVVRPQVRRSNTQKQSPRISSTTVQRRHVKRPVKQRPRTTVKPKRKPTSRNKPAVVATVHRYSDKPKTEVITQREVQSVLKAPVVKRQARPVETRSEASPYDNIPDSSKSAQQNQNAGGSSPAVKSLIIRARTDMAIGRDQSAISKIERALRIESDNGELWYLLGKAHQALSNHQQAITMAKKAINFAGANETLAIKSWKLIKLSGEASGDTAVVQEAINYNKINP